MEAEGGNPATTVDHQRQSIECDVRQQFGKQFHFTQTDGKPPALPSPDVLFQCPPYSVPSLQRLKQNLNGIKNQLNDFEINNWHQHTRRRSSLYAILNELRRRIRGEFVTQAFAKLYECVSAYDLVDEHGTTYRSVHLCEAPGAFITALNHYLRVGRPRTKWDWFASTLNPYHEGNSINNMITDDRFILHTLDNWCFGADYTGDIMVRENVDEIVHRSHRWPMINLVTADGSIDCLDVPEEQETLVAKLHQAEVVTALKILGAGGHFILKMFTFFEHSSVNVLFLLHVCFAQLHVFKPCTSKPGNSEVYVIAKDYRKPVGIDAYLDVIYENLHSTNAMFPLREIPVDFLEQVHECASRFTEQQRNIIEQNIRFYREPDPLEDQRIEDFKQAITRTFFDVYPIRPIRQWEKILHGIDAAKGFNINPHKHHHQGTHNERIASASISCPAEWCESLRTRLENLVLTKSTLNPAGMATGLAIDERCHSMETAVRFTVGKPIVALRNSKFATVVYVQFLDEVLRYHRTVSHGRLSPIDHQDDTISVNVSAYPSVDDVSAFEHTMFRVIFERVGQLSATTGNQLVLENWLLLTQFNVGLLFLLKEFVFEELELLSYTRIRLKRLRANGKSSMLYLGRALFAAKKSCSPANVVLGMTPIQLTLSDVHFYSAIVNYNNDLCLHYCSQLIA